jgi:two-component system, NarL family, nitrate/nitrite response regulator NarL
VIRILICSPIRLYCEGLARLFGGELQFDVVGTACGGQDWVQETRRVDPDVVLVDLALPRSVEAIRALSETAPSARVVAMSVPQEEGTVIACARAGVRSLVCRDASSEDVCGAIVRTAHGESLGPDWLMPMLLRRVAAGADGPVSPALQRLTRREREVLTLIDEGLSNKAIARHLRIELPTVKNHVHNILEKLGVSRRGEAVAQLNRAPV